MVEKLHVSLGARSYDILIGGGLLASSAEMISPFLPRKSIRIVTDKNVAEHHLAGLLSSLEAAEIDTQVLVLEPGEATKSWASLQEVVEWFLAKRLSGMI